MLHIPIVKKILVRVILEEHSIHVSLAKMYDKVISWPDSLRCNQTVNVHVVEFKLA